MRTYLITGAAGDIGRATADRLTAEGHRVLRSDLHQGDIAADLSSPEGRAEFADAVAEIDRLDGFIAVAGVMAPDPVTVRLNYFGTLAALRAVRPRLAAAPAGRAVVVSSLASITPTDSSVVAACLDDREATAVAAAERVIKRGRGRILYGSSKFALNVAVRRLATEWAGSGVPLNAVAPGVVDTATARRQVLEDPITAELTEELMPQPLGFPGPVNAVADSLAWLTSEANRFLTGQLIFVDGGAEALLRGDRPARLKSRHSLRKRLELIKRYRSLKRTAARERTAVREETTIRK